MPNSLSYYAFRGVAWLTQRFVIGQKLQIERTRAFLNMSADKPLLPRGTALKPIVLESPLLPPIKAEWITPFNIVPERVVLALHGGGWVTGLYNHYRWLYGQIALATGMRLLAIDYRLAPEHPFPSGLDDCLAAYRWLLASGVKPEHITCIGDSAGGNLLAAMLLQLRDAHEPLPASVVYLSPVLDLTLSGASIQTNGHQDVGIGKVFLDECVKLYVGSHAPKTPTLSPVFGDLSGLPPSLIQVGSAELLLDDAKGFAAALKQAQVDTTLEIWDDMWHGWYIYTPFLKYARLSVNAMAVFIKQHMR